MADGSLPPVPQCSEETSIIEGSDGAGFFSSLNTFPCIRTIGNSDVHLEYVRHRKMRAPRMVTLKDLAEDWIEARAALKQHIKMLESDLVSSQAGLSEDVRSAIAARIHKAISELNALLKELPGMEV